MKKIVILLASAFILSGTRAQWTQMNPPHIDTSYLFSVNVPNAAAVWANSVHGADNPEIAIGGTAYYIRTADGGANWKFDSVPVDSGYVIANISAIDADTCYVATGSPRGGKIYKTIDGGQSWTVSYTSTTWVDDVYFWNAQEGIAIVDPKTTGFKVLKTMNYGASWAAIPVGNMPAHGTAEYPYASRFSVVGNHIWVAAVANVVRVFHSADRGLHWTAAHMIDSTSTPGVEVDVTGIADMVFADSLHGVVSSNQLFVTANGGALWERKLNYSGTFYNNYLAAVPGSNTVFSSSTGAYGVGSSYSNDFGNSWITIDTGNAYWHSAMAFLNDTLGLGGEYKYNSSSFGGIFKWGPTATAVNNISNPEISVSVFPNPASNSIVLKVTKANNKVIQLGITDETGKLVFSDSYFNADNFFMQPVNISSLANGLYFVNIRAGENSYTQKLIHTFY